jgi:hypothetical protein
MKKASDVFGEVRALIGDPEGDWATDDHQLPFLRLAIDTLVNDMLENPNIGRYKTVVEIPNLAAGERSLGAHFASGGQLAGLKLVLSMKEKAAGADESQYTPMIAVSDIPTDVRGLGINRFFRFDGDDIHLPGASVALDVRIFGEFDPAPVTDGDSPILPNSLHLLKLATASLVAGDHGNRRMEEKYAAMYERALGNRLNHIVMEMQGTPVRPRAYSGYGG